MIYVHLHTCTESLPAEFDSRVKAMEVDEKPTEQFNDVGGKTKSIYIYIYIYIHIYIYMFTRVFPFPSQNRSPPSLILASRLWRLTRSRRSSSTTLAVSRRRSRS